MGWRALDRSEKVLGKVYPDTLTSVSNLAVVLERQGKYEVAERDEPTGAEREREGAEKKHQRPDECLLPGLLIVCPASIRACPSH
jgi:hypothetical protein